MMDENYQLSVFELEVLRKAQMASVTVKHDPAKVMRERDELLAALKESTERLNGLSGYVLGMGMDYSGERRAVDRVVLNKSRTLIARIEGTT